MTPGVVTCDYPLCSAPAAEGNSMCAAHRDRVLHDLLAPLLGEGGGS
jgi:hypothetical protein